MRANRCWPEAGSLFMLERNIKRDIEGNPLVQYRKLAYHSSLCSSMKEQPRGRPTPLAGVVSTHYQLGHVDWEATLALKLSEKSDNFASNE